MCCARRLRTVQYRKARACGFVLHDCGLVLIEHGEGGALRFEFLCSCRLSIVKERKTCAFRLSELRRNGRDAVRVQRISPEKCFHYVSESIAVTVRPGSWIYHREPVRGCDRRIRS